MSGLIYYQRLIKLGLESLELRRIRADRLIFGLADVQLWNRLPEQVVSAGSVRAFISRLNSILVSFFNVLC